MVQKNTGLQAKNGHSGNDVPDRLLDAAEKLFCQRGFNDTSVRDLTKAAGCNIAAVNYYFGGKNQLYLAMFQRHMDRIFTLQKQNINKVMNSSDPSVEKLLTALIRTALEPIGQSRSNGRIPLLKLMVREVLNPHLKEDFLALDMVRDFLLQIRRALMKLLPDLDEDRATLCVFSLEGLVLHPMLFSDFYDEMYPEWELEKIVSHIVEFAAAGIREAATNK